jgi:hypothetical protein
MENLRKPELGGSRIRKNSKNLLSISKELISFSFSRTSMLVRGGMGFYNRPIPHGALRRGATAARAEKRNNTEAPLRAAN